MNSSVAESQSFDLLNNERNTNVIRTPRICFLMPYFGKWPFWMPLFLESCRRNHDIDWLFFSDCGVFDNLPDNVLIRSISYEDYCAFVRKRLGIDFHPATPYKLCDAKPTLGFIHEEDLENHDFWAFGDIDLIYGKLRDHYTNERLARYDLISNHARRISGHLCLIRNTPKMRELFMKIPNWKARLSDERHQALDEGAFSRLFLWRKNFPKPLFKLVGLFNPLRRKSEFNEAFSTPNAGIDWIDGSRDFPKCWYWKEGSLTNDKDGEREFPYFHFLVWKSNDWSTIKSDEVGDAMRMLARQKSWRISASGFKAMP
jgi:hypothetical protein